MRYILIVLMLLISFVAAQSLGTKQEERLKALESQVNQLSAEKVYWQNVAQAAKSDADSAEQYSKDISQTYSNHMVWFLTALFGVLAISVISSWLNQAAARREAREEISTQFRAILDSEVGKLRQMIERDQIAETTEVLYWKPNGQEATSPPYSYLKGFGFRAVTPNFSGTSGIPRQNVIVLDISEQPDANQAQQYYNQIKHINRPIIIYTGQIRLTQQLEMPLHNFANNVFTVLTNTLESSRIAHSQLDGSGAVGGS